MEDLAEAGLDLRRRCLGRLDDLGARLVGERRLVVLGAEVPEVGRLEVVGTGDGGSIRGSSAGPAAPGRSGLTAGAERADGGAAAAGHRAGATRRPARTGAGADADRSRSRPTATGGRPAGAAGRAHAVPVAVAALARTGAAAAARPVGGRDLAGEALRAAGGRLVPVDREVGEERDVLALVVDPAGDRAGSGRRSRSARVSSYRRGKTTTSIAPWRSSRVTIAIVARAFVTTIRTPVTIPPTTTRCPSSDSSRRSPE